MPFNLQAVLGSTTVSLYDGAPFMLRTARGMGGADVRRVTTQGAAQHGDTDKGYRLQPREIELVIGFDATTDAILDGYRDTLNGIFKPLSATPVNLRVTRDDGEIRQIDCNVVGAVDIKLVKEHRPGHYHEATVRLRAADPAWYELAPGTVSFTGTVNYATNWQLAGGAISSGQVLMSGGTPSAGAWSYTGTIPLGTSWTLAVRADYLASSGTESYMYNDNGGTVATLGPSFGKSGTVGGTTYYLWNDTNYLYDLPSNAAGGMNTGIANYFHTNDSNGYTYRGSVTPAYRQVWSKSSPGGSGTIVAVAAATSVIPVYGTAMAWRTLGWAGTVRLYALYSPGLNEAQRNALNIYMAGTAGSANTSVVVPYEGDLPEYPVISLTGPVTAPTITNQATGDRLSFGTNAIGAGTTYVIDTRYGYKTVLQGTVSRRSQLSGDSDLGEWHLAPNPVAVGGTNLVTVEGSGMSAATTLQVVYYNRYQGY